MRMHGRHASLAFAYKGQDLMQTVGQIKEAHARDNYHAIAVDDTGIGGGVTDALDNSRDLQRCHIVPVNFGAKSDFPDRYVNMKAQIAFAVRAELKAGFEDQGNPHVGLSIPADRRLAAQLTAHRQQFDDRNRFRVQTVTEERGANAFALTSSSSPDHAHALFLVNYARSQAVIRRARGVVPTAVRELNLEAGHHVGLAAEILRDPG